MPSKFQTTVAMAEYTAKDISSRQFIYSAPMPVAPQQRKVTLICLWIRPEPP